MNKNLILGLGITSLVVFSSFSCGCRSGIPKNGNSDVNQLVNRLDPQGIGLGQGIGQNAGTVANGKSTVHRFDPLKESAICTETAASVAKAGHLKEAIRLYEKARSLSPDDLSIAKQLAPLYAQAGNFDQAIGVYQDLMRTEKNDPELVNNFAWTLMEGERLDEAKALASSGLASFPESKNLNGTLAVIMYKQGDRKSALELFSKALGEHAAHHNLAVLDIDSKDRVAAQNHLNRAMEVKSSPLTIRLSDAMGVESVPSDQK